ncbi:CDP-glycerol glycerophosphotransferase family protein [Terrisporobacter petrolearius]|uniref:CDP-glycerol glycerophosphotransferase family protein n=1 Tax=Terrisporobacter petrolearius TaxID=1460447 RepID=UPI001D167BC0|nr:CDP-glycerol glycerophosphotransferase family protein [Terrisporobacter petrolearius]MCC3863783.1 CDP-glycerol glycerophosphotransferase family protein [Terrisporobacter petrolearius]
MKKKLKKKLKKIIIKILSITPITKQLAVNLTAWDKKRNYLKKFYNKEIINDKLIVFEAYMGRQYSCSPKSLYKAMLEDDQYKDFIKVWAFKKPKEHEDLLKNDNTVVVKYKSKQYYKYYSTAKYWVTNSRIPNEIKKHPDQIYIQCWHGTPLKKLGLDIENYTGTKISTKDLHHNYKVDAQRYSYLVSPSNFFNEKITSAFGLKDIGKDNIFIKKGYPRNDFLYEFTEEDCERIKENLNIPRNKKVILYAPTWRENQHEPGVGYTYDLGLNFDILQKELEDEYVILFRAHYFISNAFNFEKYNGFIINASNHDDINELYIVSDMLITDYSSVFFDYANLSRPIIFYMYDFEEYKNKMRDFYLSVKDLPGPIVKDEINLLKEINKLGTDFVYDEKYEEFNNRFNPHRKPCSLEVLSECI